jgi:hypothetical protein
MKRLALIIAAATAASTALAWSDSGHGAIAKIAYRHLTPTAKRQFDEMLKVGVAERYHNGPMAAVWADEVRGDRAETGPWHYINIHFRTDGKPVTMKPLDENVAWAIDVFNKVLADKRADREKRAEAFRWILHFVGDAHQPLHNVARDTDKSPEGDRGGNDFAIVPGNGLPSWNTNLHRVWDSGCGAFELPMRGGNPGFEEECAKLADRIEAKFPLATLKEEVKDLNPMSWVQDGFKIAKEFAYTAPEGGTPNEAYVRTGQEICMKRAALAGYRLAAILNEALK